MHNGRDMAPSTLRQQRVAEWIDAHIGARTLKQMASDIAETGWPIDHSRLGRYRNRKLQVGPEVVQHFNDYAAARDLPPVDLDAREDIRSLEERAVIAAEAQAKAIADLVAELREWRQSDRDRIAGLETSVTGLLTAVAPIEQGAGVPQAPVAPGH